MEGFCVLLKMAQQMNAGVPSHYDIIEPTDASDLLIIQVSPPWLSLNRVVSPSMSHEANRRIWTLFHSTLPPFRRQLRKWGILLTNPIRTLMWSFLFMVQKVYETKSLIVGAEFGLTKTTGLQNSMFQQRN